MERSAALNWGLLVAGLLLFTAPLVAQPQTPPDVVEYSVDGDWDPVDGQQKLSYANFSTAQQDVFERANASDGPVNVTLAESPDRLTPPPDGIEAYDVYKNGSYYLLQTVHFTHERDLIEQVLPRAIAMLAGLGALVGLAYRRLT